MLVWPYFDKGRVPTWEGCQKGVFFCICILTSDLFIYLFIVIVMRLEPEARCYKNVLINQSIPSPQKSYLFYFCVLTMH